MSHGSLSDWLVRRTVPGRAPISDEDDDELLDDR
jgi:hypothetical protein